MRTEDAVLSVTLAFAPYDQVMPAAIGAFRAEHGYSVAEEDVAENPIARLKRMGVEENQTNVMYVHGTTISEPIDAPGVTLIEDWSGPDRDILGALLPEVSFLSLFSLFETKSCEQHSYVWRSGPDRLRDVCLDRDMTKNGWHWSATGDFQPWEDPMRLDQRVISGRADRALLIGYAARHGIDLNQALAARKFRRSEFVWQVSEWDARSDLAATRLGDDYHKAAILAGLGQGETECSFGEQRRLAGIAQNANSRHQSFLRKLRRLRSAKSVLSAAGELGRAPKDEFAAYMYFLCWLDAIDTVQKRFPGEPERQKVEQAAVDATRHMKEGRYIVERINTL